MIGSTVREYKDIRKNLRLLLEGVVVAIDPSIGSNSSMPGWAVSRAGKRVASGVFEIDPGASVGKRLQSLSNHLRKLYNRYDPDLVVYEDIAPRRYGGGSAHAHSSLLKSVGAILSVAGPTEHIGLRPTIWTRYKRSTYVKGDEADAIEILYVALETAREIVENDAPRAYGGKGTTGSSRKKKVSKSKSKSKTAGTLLSEKKRKTLPPF